MNSRREHQCVVSTPLLGGWARCVTHRERVSAVSALPGPGEARQGNEKTVLTRCGVVQVCIDNLHTKGFFEARAPHTV